MRRRKILKLGPLLLAVVLAVNVNAFMRSLPENVEIPTAARQTPVKIRKLADGQIWTRIFDRGGASAEQIRRSADWMRVEQQVTGHPLIAGNQVELLIDGPMTFDAMFDAMRGARHHIHLETFIFDDEALSRQLVEILIERHRAGVEVRLVIDGYGALQSDESVLDPLREAGVALFIYHPVESSMLLRFWRLNTRHHRKMLIVDGRVGILGGINISNVYTRSSTALDRVGGGHREGWRDTSLKVQGPIVAELQRLFVPVWAAGRDAPLLAGASYFPDLPAEGRFILRVVSSMAEDEAYEVYRTYRNAFAHARETIWITQGYFSPSRFDQPRLSQLHSRQ